MALTDFAIIRRSLAARAFATAVTVLMVAIAAGLTLVLLCMPGASRDAFERSAGDMHMVVSRDASPLTAVLNNVFYANAPRRALTWAQYEDITRRFPLEYAVPVQLGDSYRGRKVVATDETFFQAFRPSADSMWTFAAGRPFETDFEAVLGADVAASLGLGLEDQLVLTHGIVGDRGPVAMPDTVPAPVESDPPDDHDHTHDDHDHDHDHDHADDEHDHDHDHGDDDHAHDGDDHGHTHDHGPGHVHDEYGFKVVGVLDRTGGPVDRVILINLNSTWILHAHDRIEREAGGHIERIGVDELTEADRLITGIYIRVAARAGAQMSGAQQQVFSALRTDPQIMVADPVQEVTNLFEIIGYVDGLMFAMAIIVMVSSALSIMLVLYSSMAQRRRQIAVLRVLGCSRPRIFGMVLTESAVIGAIGAILGVALAYLGGIIVAGSVRQALGLSINVVYPLQSTLLIVVGVILLAAAAGVVPAMAAYRTAVVRHLRPLD